MQGNNKKEGLTMKSLIVDTLHSSFEKTKETSAKLQKQEVTRFVETCFALSSVERNQTVLVTPAGNFSLEEYEIHSPMAGLLLPCSVTVSGDDYFAKELRKQVEAYTFDPKNVMTPWEFKRFGLEVAGLYRKQFNGVSAKSKISPVLLSTVDVVTDGTKVKADNPGSLSALPVPLTVAEWLYEEVAFRDGFADVINRVIVNIIQDLKAKQN